ncbi:hypothetical protein TMP139_360052 [Tenacibaculum maritimum]|nr:hypothetical protein TMP139_360052 [Tenacibaculum maritimum]
MSFKIWVSNWLFKQIKNSYEKEIEFAEKSGENCYEREC